MGLPEKSLDFLKRISHRSPRKLYRLFNESFEIARGYAWSLQSKSKDIRQAQKRLLIKNFPETTRNLIIFLTPGIDMVNGGILSVTSLYEETKRLNHIHNAEAILCTYPSDPQLLKYTKFKNSNYLFNLSDTLRHFKNLDSLIIHLPEHFVYRFVWFLSKTDRDNFKKIRNVQINLMIQNIDYLPSAKRIRRLAALGKLTATTAHTKYSTLEIRNRLGFPLHKLSVFVSPEKYLFKRYREKENLMIVSPDPNPKKTAILKSIRDAYPNLTIKIIKQMTYEEYKETISRAKWALTFGEGLDGYFLETVFSGGVSFSIYNTKYFTSEFRDLRTLYANYAVLAEKIIRDIAELYEETLYGAYQRRQFDLCKSLYDHKTYVKNLEAFYRGQYTYC